MKRSRTEKSPWIKSKTKLGPNKKKIDEIHSDRGLNLAESDKGSWSINSRKARQLVLHLWMYQQSVRKNNGSKESGRKKCYERATSQNESGLFFIVGFFIVRNESSVCSCFVVVGFFHFVLSFVDHGCVWLLVPALRHLLLGLLLFRRSTSLPLRFAHSWPRLNRVRLERDCNTIAFPRSSSLQTVNARGSVISLARRFSSWHIPLWRRDMFLNL